MELVAAGATPSVAEVAAAADVSRRTVYSYFPSLDQLMVDATLGLVSGAETAAVLDELDGEPAGRRIEALAREIQAMDPEAERLGRKLIALTIEGEGPGDGTPRRGFRRVEWIEQALEPLRERLDDERFERLVSALALVIGFEALVVERDVRGLTSGEAAETSAWAARALLTAALSEATDHQAPPGSELQRRVEKPWGHEIWWAQTDSYAGKLLIVKAGQRLSLQVHEEKDETSYLLSGRLLLVQGPSEDELTERTLEPGCSWRNEPGLIHTIEALEDATVVEVSTPELDDVVRLSDRYGR